MVNIIITVMAAFPALRMRLERNCCPSTAHACFNGEWAPRTRKEAILLFDLAAKICDPSLPLLLSSSCIVCPIVRRFRLFRQFANFGLFLSNQAFHLPLGIKVRQRRRMRKVGKSASHFNFPLLWSDDLCSRTHAQAGKMNVEEKKKKESGLIHSSILRRVGCKMHSNVAITR